MTPTSFRITVLGQGAMGLRMADRLQAAGYAVTRWNRTGATATPREAAADADVVLAMLRDDDASAGVWLDPRDGALAGMRPQALAIESSTITREHALALADAARARGVRFLDAPVLGSRPQAEAGQLIHLIGGDAADVDAASAVLAAVGARRLHVGPAGAGAALKLIANALFGVQVALLAELLARASALGLDPARTLEALGETPLLSAGARGAAGLMLAGRDAPMFPVELVAKDFRYAIDGHPDAMPVAAAALAVFERAAGQGLGDANLTAVHRLYGTAPAAVDAA